MAAAQANEEDRDLDDPDFAAKKVTLLFLMRKIVGKAKGNRNRKWKGRAGLLFSQLLFVIVCCSNPLTSLFHVFCIVLSPIYPNIKTDASSRTNDRPRCTLLDSFLASMIWCSSNCTNCSYKIVWHQLFACLFVSSPPNISHSRLEGWMMALHTRLATPPNSDEGQEKTERVGLITKMLIIHMPASPSSPKQS